MGGNGKTHPKSVLPNGIRENPIIGKMEKMLAFNLQKLEIGEMGFATEP